MYIILCSSLGSSHDIHNLGLIHSIINDEPRVCSCKLTAFVNVGETNCYNLFDNSLKTIPQVVFKYILQY